VCEGPPWTNHSLLCSRAKGPVLEPGAVLAQCVKRHCGRIVGRGVPRQCEDDLRCVKCHCGESLLCLWATGLVLGSSAVLAQCVKCPCGELSWWGVPRQIEGVLRQKSGGHEPERIPTTRECENHLLQMVTTLEQGAEEATREAGWKAADPSRYPQQMCRGLARLLSQGTVSSENAQRLARHIGGLPPPGWGSVEGEGMWRASGYTS